MENVFEHPNSNKENTYIRKRFHIRGVRASSKYEGSSQSCLSGEQDTPCNTSTSSTTTSSSANAISISTNVDPTVSVTTASTSSSTTSITISDSKAYIGKSDQDVAQQLQSESDALESEHQHADSSITSISMRMTESERGQVTITKSPKQSDILQELNGTPSIALRKGLLHRQIINNSTCNTQELSPNLKMLSSTPALANLRSVVEKQLDSHQIGQSFTLQSEQDSPGLIRLRQTPGKTLKEKRQTLEEKHDATRKNADTLNVGGGVSLWPEMNNMRLAKLELLYLTVVSIALASLTFIGFNEIHGSTLLKLTQHSMKLKNFSVEHAIDTTDSDHFRQSVVTWHQDFTTLIDEIKYDFKLDESDCHVFYVCAACYVGGVSTLLYYLADNVLSKNKLSPNRIKKWVCLLAIVGSWTVSLCRLFINAYLLERIVEESIYHLNSYQRLLIYIPVDSSVYDHVLRYWSVEYLSPSTKGVLQLFGLIQFNSVVHYVQYYSLPIVTALITPVIKLTLSLLYIYGFIEHESIN